MCSIEGCGRPVRQRGWCNRHYLRWQRHGDPLAGRPPWDEFTVPPEKACRNCGVVKPLEQFATRSSARDGKSAWCKECFQRQYRKNVELRAEQRQAWTAANPEYFKNHYLANRERRIAQSTAYVREHREERRAYEAKYRADNRDRLNEISAAYQRRTGHKYSRARSAAKRTRVIDVVDRREVYRLGDGLCGICREPVEFETFHVDHIIPLSRGGEHSYANTQPSHPVCNLRKGARIDDAPSGNVAA